MPWFAASVQFSQLICDLFGMSVPRSIRMVSKYGVPPIYLWHMRADGNSNVPSDSQEPTPVNLIHELRLASRDTILQKTEASEESLNVASTDPRSNQLLKVGIDTLNCRKRPSPLFGQMQFLHRRPQWMRAPFDEPHRLHFSH